MGKNGSFIFWTHQGFEDDAWRSSASTLMLEGKWISISFKSQKEEKNPSLHRTPIVKRSRSIWFDPTGHTWHLQLCLNFVWRFENSYN